MAKGKTQKAKSTQRSKDVGVGDVIESALNSKAIKPITEAIKKAIWKDGEDCGCKERIEKLNKIKLYRVKCMDETLYKEFTAIKELPVMITTPIKNEVRRIYAEVFGVTWDVCMTCPGAGKKINTYHRDILKVYNTYG
jgi:hypothetical protein